MPGYAGYASLCRVPVLARDGSLSALPSVADGVLESVPGARLPGLPIGPRVVLEFVPVAVGVAGIAVEAVAVPVGRLILVVGGPAAVVVGLPVVPEVAVPVLEAAGPGAG